MTPVLQKLPDYVIIYTLDDYIIIQLATSIKRSIFNTNRRNNRFNAPVSSPVAPVAPAATNSSSEQASVVQDGGNVEEFAGNVSSTLIDSHIPRFSHLWCADTGASSHMTPHKDWFETYEPYAVPIRAADVRIEVCGLQACVWPSPVALYYCVAVPSGLLPQESIIPSLGGLGHLYSASGHAYRVIQQSVTLIPSATDREE